MIGMAGFFVVAGLLIWYLERRRHGRNIGRQLLIGLPGVYLAGVASISSWKWLYVPGLGLVAAYYLMPFVGRRAKRAATDGERRGRPTRGNRR